MLPFDTAELRRCIGDEKTFIADVWGKRIHATTGGIPASDLISVRDIDRLLTSQPLLRSDMIRLVRQGEVLPRNAYLRSMREIYPRPVDHEMTENEYIFEMLTRGVASAAEVTAAVRGGATLILDPGEQLRPVRSEAGLLTGAGGQAVEVVLAVRVPVVLPVPAPQRPVGPYTPEQIALRQLLAPQQVSGQTRAVHSAESAPQSTRSNNTARAGTVISVPAPCSTPGGSPWSSREVSTTTS